MLYKILCKILTLYENFLIISLYIYNISSIVYFIEVCFEKYFHLIFWKGLFIHKRNLIQTITCFKSCMNSKSLNKLINTSW